MWTAEDEKSIQNIGSLELERNAAVEKLMSSRSMHRYYAADRDLIDLDLDGDGDGHQLPPGSAPSMHRNPFFFHDDQQAAASTAKLFSRHESFRPYFVADKTAAGRPREQRWRRLFLVFVFVFLCQRRPCRPAYEARSRG